MTLHKALHGRDNVDILCVSRKKGGRAIDSSKDSVDASTQRPEHYREKQGGLMTATKNDTNRTKTNRTASTKKQKGKEKQLYGRFKRLINYISHEKNLDMAKKRKH